MWRRRGHSLAEEINSLVDPRPNYEREEEEEETAKICLNENLDEEDLFDNRHFEEAFLPKNKKMLSGHDDPKYGGRSISRDEMNDYDTPESSDDEILSEEEEGEGDETSSEEEEKEVGGASMGGASLLEPIEDSTDVPILPLANNNDDDGDVDKGKAVKDQLALWDGLLEGRIKLQTCLNLSHQLPQNETAAKFFESGPLASTSLNQCETSLNKLMRNLLSLQKTLIEKLLDFVPPNEEKEERGELGGDWYEGIIEKRHKGLRCYRDEVLDKWSTRLQLASGKLTMKSYSYQSRHQSIVANIQYSLKAQAKLRKRTQLKRTQQQLVTLGKRKREGEPERDYHLNDIDEEIFNDEDFYHQLLRELIQSKTSFTDTDQISMGKKWLEIQSLRAKVKKRVDTKASKGRKLRYHVHQKLVGLMAPINSCDYSESARYNLFSSLFDSRKRDNSNYTDTTS